MKEITSAEIVEFSEAGKSITGRSGSLVNPSEVAGINQAAREGRVSVVLETTLTTAVVKRTPAVATGTSGNKIPPTFYDVALGAAELMPAARPTPAGPPLTPAPHA